jgi:hypothetical protein
MEKIPRLINAADIPGNFNNDDIVCVDQIVSSFPISGHLVEIGCLFGKSTVAWLSSLQKHNKNFTVTAIDKFTDGPMQEEWWTSIIGHGRRKIELFKEHTQGYDNLQIIETGFWAHRFEWNTPVTAVFYDGDHSEDSTYAALNFWKDHLTEDGILVCHDINMPEVQMAVEWFCKNNNFVTEPVYMDSSLIVLKRNPAK